MPRLDWLTARPLAHRGLHDAPKGVIENTPSAFTAAIAGNYGIELDLQISADGEAMVHHDDALGRLTEGTRRIAEMSAAELKAVRFKATTDRMLTLGELLDLVGGRVTLAIELKSRFDGDLRLVERAAKVLAAYQGPFGVMSFDPEPIEALRRLAPGITRGIVAQRSFDRGWDQMPASRQRELGLMLHAPRTRPQFLAYSARQLTSAPPLVAHYLFGLPLLAWTIHNAADGARALRIADQVIFEDYRA